MKSRCVALFKKRQQEICDALQECDGKASFGTDVWERPDAKGSFGGGGITRVLKDGAVFEQAGVNFSEVQGSLPQSMTKKLTGADGEAPFFATGVSLVIHPTSPMIPTVHANFRYLEVGDNRWFGGGTDLTPYYLWEEDAVHFHTVLKHGCDRFDTNYFPVFKKTCDHYFYLPHRGETRGIGGIFFDYLGKDDGRELEPLFQFVEGVSGIFLSAYLPIVTRRRDEHWGEKERSFQLIRRGRYAEFNLLHDRGTQFGLETGGRTESILMSLPPQARWEYGYEPEPNSREAALLKILRSPRDWV